MQKYGFVYIWYDRSRKMFYIGRHWGTEDDGYICSSNKMRDAYYRRPQDFKRKILSLVYTNVDDLVEEEQRFLDKIKPKECGVKYYNVSLRSTIPTMRGRKHSEETKQKISKSNKGKIVSEKTKEKLRKIQLEKMNSYEIIEKLKKHQLSLLASGETKGNLKWMNNNRSEETRRKISENNKRLHAEGRIGMLGKNHSEETKKKMSINNAMNKEEYRNKIRLSKRGSLCLIKGCLRKMAVPGTPKYEFLINEGFRRI